MGVIISSSIQWKNAPSPKAKSRRKERDKKQGHFRCCRLEERREFRKNPFESRMLVYLSLLLIKASHNQD